MLVPKLRFKEFSGEWNCFNIKDKSNLITKGTTPPKFSFKGVRFIKIESLNGHLIDNNKCLFIDEKTNLTVLKRSILEENDILFAIAGATIGKCGIVKRNNLPANTNQALAIIRLSNNINSLFLLNILNSNAMQKYIDLNISTGAQPNLNLEQIGSFKFCAPAIKEQTKIADFLSLLDKKIQLQQEKIETLKLYKKSLIQLIFKEIIKFKNNNYKNESLYPLWEEAKISDIVKFNNNKVENIKEYKKITIGLNHTGIRFFNETRSMQDSRPFYLRKKGEIILGKQNYFNGSIAIIPNEFDNTICSNAILSFEVTEEVNNLFLYYFLSNPDYYKKLKSLANGTGQKELSEKDFKDFKVKLPILDEQVKISSFLYCLENNFSKEQEKLNLLNNLKKGLMQNMFV